ncbi:ATP-binding cassette domain-containing protein [Methylobacterium aquaticum]|uniref:ATP-binding cassette domain-containing protein n=1 Tax=Methylobacterium aquaticum TaxID=270351 RepID=UPI00069E4B4D|nr:ATP-binding cassette domain-containing protein [Methylobacterium aquaticum]
MPFDSQPLVELAGVGKSFGALRALTGIDLRIAPGRVVAVMGHNGAGKSTLMNVLTGTLPRDAGTLSIAGEAVGTGYGVARAHALGVRCVVQELSLCANLSVAENTRIYHRELKGLSWKRRASRLILDKLDEIFPNHGIAADQTVGDLPIAKRQMVEIARAFTTIDAPVRLVILDEPTSSLDGRSAEQLMRYVTQRRDAGCTVLFISHRMVEVMNHTDDVVVKHEARLSAA